MWMLTFDPSTDAGLITGVRFFRLFALQRRRHDGAEAAAATDTALGALFVAEQCKEVDFQRPVATTSTGAIHEAFGARDSQGDQDLNGDDLTVFNVCDQRIVAKLPPTRSTVVDVQVNAFVAAVLCEGNEILLYDALSLQLVRTIETSSTAMALGQRWLAYPRHLVDFAQERDSLDASFADDTDESVPEALVGGAGTAFASDSAKTRAASYSAIDVAQNVASGLYYLSATIAPYLASSPGTTPSMSSSSMYSRSEGSTPVLGPQHTPASWAGGASTSGKQRKSSSSSSSTAATSGGWVVVHDLLSDRVLFNFKCHSTALVTLSFDDSGLLLATSSSKGQNLHIYRLMPPLQTTLGRHREQYQLLYKLQRGITHASIQDIAFSADSKWVNVTSSHGTSHLYAIHPEGVPINPETHVNVIASEDIKSAPGERYTTDFYADYRSLETRAMAQVLKLRHGLPVVPQAAPSGPRSLGSSTMMESALDASQAFFHQLAQSSAIRGGISRIREFGDESDPEVRRRKRRRRIACMFSTDNRRMAICAYGTLKVYDFTSQMASKPRSGHGLNGTAVDQTTKYPFGLDVQAKETKSWDVLVAGRVRSVPVSSDGLQVGSRSNQRSELRTFPQRSLSLWAHPKVTFKAIDNDHPAGQVLQVKRKGPNFAGGRHAGAEGVEAAEQDQVFVLEMDSYFGLGGSPVFDGQSGSRPATPPPLDLSEHISNAMGSSLPDSVVAMEGLSISPGDSSDILLPGDKKRRKKRSGAPAVSGLQFTIQDMYFAAPKEKIS
ncbi:TPA: hypothetical protein N0F65_013006 [Lagenidium giganteum]|uniref:BCAS3 WD40 domain-containing protein n=1 Tax=Lagenidium giganteum TaxID=4803 RepID=A0AAV2YKA8_9STRA|nr:TPA: hypothetical protein N0F65_013006 [Lagenidium giganteum]